MSSLDEIIQLASETNTLYCRNYVVKPFEQLKAAVYNDFKEDDNFKPAKLSVVRTGKKYPFSEGAKQAIQLLVQNDSTGYALDVIVSIELHSDEVIHLRETSNYVGTIQSSALVNFDYTGKLYSESVFIIGNVSWVNINDESCSKSFDIELQGQKDNINWSKIQRAEPYDLEAVTDKDDFIGRKKIIKDLTSVGKKVSSSYIFGQRRVGKTSIVKTMQSIVNPSDTLVIYTEAGDWDSATSPHRSMEDLAGIICKKIIKHDKKYSLVDKPDFDGSFHRLTNYLDDISDIDSSFRILIILDEFDRISSSLLYPGSVANSFMNTIRAISNRPNYGFVLVGGEKLEYLLSQWQEFNKFKPIRVDYFDKKTEWEDFKSLIRHPVQDYLEISDKAIDFIYNQTSGNPYFTKKVCIEMFNLMVHNRDTHVTDREARQAADMAIDLNNIGATDFSHFWKDGIKEKEIKEEEISINRRKVLLAVGQLLISKKVLVKSSIIDSSISNGLNILQAEKTLDEFVQRKILFIENNIYSFVVKFFSDWLVSGGLETIITTFEEEQRLVLMQEYEKQISVKQEELLAIASNWPQYRGRDITVDHLRDWLNQFDGFQEQRLMYQLLEGVKFYSYSLLRDKMTELFQVVQKIVNKHDKVVKIKERFDQRKKADILVSYLDQSPFKSGSEYSKLFVEANNIYTDNSCAPDKLDKRLSELENVNGLVFVDDFLGTGKSITENLDSIIPAIKPALIDRNIVVVIGIITGYQEAKHSVLKYAQINDFPIDCVLLDPLDNSDKCFHEDSSIYGKPGERSKAKDICSIHGVKLEPRHPLGFGDCQAAIVFPNTCPNNSLPILWKEVKDWKPLFKRG